MLRKSSEHIKKHMRKADGLGSDFDFPEVIFFEELSYRDLEIRDLHENSLRVIIFPSHSDVLFV